MKKIAILVLVFLCLFCGCDETEADYETFSSITSNTDVETAKKMLFGLTEKEIEAIEDIIGKPYVGGPYALDDVEEIIHLGYDKMYVSGELVENKNLIEYKVIYKNGETQIVSINKTLLED